MATTVTLNVTGRDIVSALRAGKSVMVHYEGTDGYEEYTQPIGISFSESEDVFHMTVYIDSNTWNFHAALDDLLIASSGGGTK